MVITSTMLHEWMTNGVLDTREKNTIRIYLVKLAGVCDNDPYGVTLEREIILCLYVRLKINLIVDLFTTHYSVWPYPHRL